MLEKFRKAKAYEIEELKRLKARGALPAPFSGKRPDFKAALKASGELPAVIAEYKRASPSRGLICASVDVEEAAAQYLASGAAALSVLTEKDYFDGELEFITRAYNVQTPAFSAPILRKDFIFDPIQIEATAGAPASAMLLIVKILPDAQKLRDFRLLGEKFGIQSAVEIFNEDELKIARQSGASIIQVNARDLQALKVDRAACLDLPRRHPPKEGELWIAASGMDSREHLLEARAAGYGAALLGTALMTGGEPGKRLKELLEPGHAD